MSPIFRIELTCLALLVLGLNLLPAGAAERDWQEQWCPGETEYILRDRTRVDCLTDHYAIEFDYGRKWAEAIGQALYYSAMTGRQAGIVLIIQDQSECRFLRRLRDTIHAKNLSIQVWTTPLDCTY